MMTLKPSANPIPPTEQPRRRQLVRAEVPVRPPLQITERDLAILQAVDDYEVLTTTQILRLLFARTAGGARGPLVQCQRRLAKLFHHGLLQRDEQPTRLSEGRLPLLYTLERAGAELLAHDQHVELRQLNWRPRQNKAQTSQFFLGHLLQVNDVRIEVSLAAQDHGYHLDWLDERTLKSQIGKDVVTVGEQGAPAQRTTIIPDGYCNLAGANGRYHLFWEIDRRTVVGRAHPPERRDWARKVEAYIAYRKSGLFQQRFQAENFRVLTVTTGEQRLANLKHITEEMGGKARFWFTTFASLTAETVLTAPIWEVAGRSQPLPLDI